MKAREKEEIQGMIDDQLDQVSYELGKAKLSCETLKDFIEGSLLDTPQRQELRRTAATCQAILDNLTDTIGNAPHC